MFVDVPFVLARNEVIDIKGITSLETPQMYVGIIDFGFENFLGIICDKPEDFFARCLQVSLADNNNSVYSP